MHSFKSSNPHGLEGKTARELLGAGCTFIALERFHFFRAGLSEELRSKFQDVDHSCLQVLTVSKDAVRQEAVLFR